MSEERTKLASSPCSAVSRVDGRPIDSTASRVVAPAAADIKASSRGWRPMLQIQTLNNREMEAYQQPPPIKGGKMRHNEIKDLRREWVLFKKDESHGRVLGYAGEECKDDWFRRYWWVVKESGQLVKCNFSGRPRKKRNSKAPKITARPPVLRGIFEQNAQ